MKRSGWRTGVGIWARGVAGAGALALLVAGAPGCGDSGNGSDGGQDAAVVIDAAVPIDAASADGAPQDSGPKDSGIDGAILDGGGAGDAGGGGDAGGASDGGGDGGSALAPPPIEQFGGGQGLGSPVIDASPDEAGNLWAVTPDALYIRRAGTGSFRRYTNADGLHINSAVLSVAGAGANEGYLGLLGIETGNEDDAPEIRNPGKAERVTLNFDGTLTTKHYWDIHTDVSANFWITRSAYRLLYVHDGPAAGHLFMGGNHGITHIFNDQWGDHVHVEVYYLPEHSGTYGLWNGLALDPATGGLWTCGKNSCGLQSWNPDPRAWVNAKYIYAFTVFTGDHALEVPHGYKENFVGAAVTPDGTAWFLSSTQGLASWKPNGFDYNHIRSVPVPGLGSPVDVAADPDGTLWIADTDHLLRLHPDTNAVDAVSLPVNGVHRLFLDGRASPRALYVSAASGLVVYRGK